MSKKNEECTESLIQQRKLDHINICLNDNIEPYTKSPFDRYRLRYNVCFPLLSTPLPPVFASLVRV